MGKFLACERIFVVVDAHFLFIASFEGLKLAVK